MFSLIRHVQEYGVFHDFEVHGLVGRSLTFDSSVVLRNVFDHKLDSFHEYLALRYIL